jgi:hypothetical protein
MTFRIACVLFACVAAATILAPHALAETPAKPASATRPADTRPDKQVFIRFRDDGRGGGTLDTAIATYRNADGVVVHLVAAVHVGEPGYYRGLARTFETYEALLYEMVKPRDVDVSGYVRERSHPDDGHATATTTTTSPATQGRPGSDKPAAAAAVSPTTRPSPRGRESRIEGAGVIGSVQSFMRDVLKLDFQLEAIDYSRPNFVHADLDAEAFNEMRHKRGETWTGLMFRSTLRQIRRQFEGEGPPPITGFDLLAAMQSPDSARQYKLLLARQLSDVEGQLEGFDGEGEDSTVLISERNKAALRVLKRTIKEGKHNIGVFYGAGHMRGIQEALVDRMGFKLTGVEWRVAWEMRDPADAGKKSAS